MKQLRNNKFTFPSYCPYLIGLYFILLVLNITLAKSPILLVPTLLEFVVVIYFVIKLKLKRAFFLHLLFIVSCFDVTTGLGNDTILYSYYKLKLIGPIGINQLIVLSIYILSMRRYPIRDKDSYLYKCYKIFLYLALSGILIGISGICFFGYEIGAFVLPTVYIVSAIIYSELLLRLFNNESSKTIYINVVCLITAAPIAAAVCFNVFGISFKYGTEDAFIYHDLYVLAPSLLIGLIQTRGLTPYFLLAILCYSINLYVGGRGVHFMLFALSLVILLYILYTSPGNRLIKIAFPVIAFLITTYIIGVASSASQLAINKFTEMMSLANLFIGNGTFLSRIQLISESPLVRIGEVLNILDKGLCNPLGLIAGFGFGGYYTDTLGIFEGLTLGGAFSQKAISAGIYNTAHGMYPCSILYNGLIGLLILFRLGFISLKKIRSNFLYFAGFALFCYSFYCNPVTLITCLFALSGATFTITK